MNLYADDNLLEKSLAAMLQKAGHQVTLSSDAGLARSSDARHLEFAIRTERVMLTKDYGDFEDLHDLVVTCGGNHAGIIIVRFDNDAK
jgi:predicted nuclease of predicted toxin-antitoxin system